GTIYNTKTGEILENIDIGTQEKLEELKKYVKEELDMSDKVINQNLLQFRYSKSDKEYDY
ncbi:hypothetical protein, partial [Sutterella wadsworthensis]|uniref:hypothetical protein n=1 Tax=Sutterella wadsworthensis TaxID=40545 RepID=UPI0032C1B813